MGVRAWGNIQLRLELPGSTTTTLLIIPESPPVTTLPIAPLAWGSTTSTTASPLTAISREHAARGGVATSLLNVGGWDNLGGEMQPFAEVVETFAGQGVVVVLPRELGLEESAGGQGLAGLDDLFYALRLVGIV